MRLIKLQYLQEDGKPGKLVDFALFNNRLVVPMWKVKKINSARVMRRNVLRKSVEDHLVGLQEGDDYGYDTQKNFD